MGRRLSCRTVLLIASNYVFEARALGDRGLSLTRVADLPLLTALAARQSFAGAGRV